jgi:hypothetical protein
VQYGLSFTQAIDHESPLEIAGGSKMQGIINKNHVHFFNVNSIKIIRALERRDLNIKYTRISGSHSDYYDE